MPDSNRPPDAALAPCLSCRRPVPAAAVSCRACGYEVGRHNRRRLVLGTIGTFLTLSLVMAPLGVPLLWMAARHRRRAAGTVTAASSVSTGTHLRGVVRHFLASERLVDPTADFTRGGSAMRSDQPPEL